MRLLLPLQRDPFSVKRIFGTAYGLSDVATQVAGEAVDKLFPGFRRDHLVIRNDLKCGALFDEFGRVLMR